MATRLQLDFLSSLWISKLFNFEKTSLKKGLCVSEKWAVRSWKNEKAFFSKGLFVFL
jgi:hypothetical protein